MRTDEPLLVGVHGDGGDGVQAGVGDVLDLHGDAKLPHADRLVVRRRHEAPPLVHKRHRVDGRQVIVVLLRVRRVQGKSAADVEAFPPHLNLPNMRCDTRSRQNLV